MGRPDAVFAVFAVFAACAARPPAEGAGGGADAGADAAPPCADAAPCAAALAGVPVDGCGDGFAPDDAGGCVPIAPASPCPFGQVAWLGETSCHDLSPCDLGRWGSAPDEPTTQYVDVASTGKGDGTKDHPWKTLQDGVAAAAPGAVVALAAGSYVGGYVNHAVRLWGRCAALVDVAGDAGGSAVNVLGDGTDDDAVAFELHDLAIHGGDIAFLAQQARVLVDGLWVHDASSGLVVTNGSVSLTRTLVERTDYGVDHSDGTLLADRIVVRDGPAAGGLGANCGICVSSTNGHASAFIRRAAIQRVAQPAFGISADAVLDSVLVEDTPATDTSIAKFQVAPSSAIDISGEVPNGRPPIVAHVVVQRSVVARAQGSAIGVSVASVDIASTVVTGTRPYADGTRGFGLYAIIDETGRDTADIRVRASRFDGNHTASLFASDVGLDVDRVLVVDTQPDGAGKFGHGIDVSATTPRADLRTRIARTRIARSHEAGLIATLMPVDLDDVVVDDTRANGTTAIADGVVTQGPADATHPAVVAATHLVVSRSARAGLAAFGAPVSLSGCAFVDDAIDIDGEIFAGVPFTLTDLGANTCVAAGAPRPCAVLSAGLVPPVAPTGGSP